jgi:hypothetical protein
MSNTICRTSIKDMHGLDVKRSMGGDIRCLYFVVRKDLNLSVVVWYQRGECVRARRVQVRHLLVSMLCRVRSAQKNRLSKKKRSLLVRSR